MSVVVVGLSHRSAPSAVLERVCVSGDDVRKTLEELHDAQTLSEVVLLSTCNRLEVYAEVARFHPAIADITAILARHAGLPVGDLSDYLYVHFAEAAVEHLFSVTAGLDSMIVGESQVLGQVRQAYQLGSEAGSVGSVLHELSQTALRVGKRVHSDTGIDRAGASVVSAALLQARDLIGDLAGRRAVILGAGSMGALAGATLRRMGVADIVVINRTAARAERLAESLSARAADRDALAAEVADADLLISCTGASGVVVEAAELHPRDKRQLVILDLALPRDVDPAAAQRVGVSYIDLDALRRSGPLVADADVRAAGAIVAAELTEYLTEQQRLAVAPTVTALRARASEVVDAELTRLDGRLPGLDPQLRAELANTVRRAVDKVLHAPTVRVKELAATPGGDQYAAALRELFDLDQAAVESVAAVKQGPGERS